jgi:UDP-glucose 4-epimerase
MEVNLQGSRNLLDAMHEAGVKKIVFSSSAATYGEPREIPISESAETIPTNPYGASKLAVDQLLSQRALSDGIGAISLRYFNVAGAYKAPSGWLGERHNPETHLIPNVLKADNSQPLKIFGTDWPTPDKTCLRDYVHVVDLIEAHIKALRALKLGIHDVINLGSGNGYSVREVVDAASKIKGGPSPTVEVERRAGDPAVLVASIEKARKILDWSPMRNMEEMMSDAYASQK